MAEVFYHRAPYAVQALLVNLYALRVHRERYGRKFTEALAELERTARFSAAEIAAYQDERLQRLVRHAYDTVPYYRDLFGRTKLRPADIRSTADLPKIPVLTREAIRQNLDALCTRAVPKAQLIEGHTSGTTGTALTFFWDRATCVYTNAADWRQKAWAGVQPGDPMVVMYGRPMVPSTRTRPPFWHLDRLHNQLWMSVYHLGPSYLPAYVEKLRRFRPVALDGYPKSVATLAGYLLSIGETFPLKAVFTSSEALVPQQREKIEEAFACKVFDFLGMSERVIFGSECAHHSGKHLNMEYAANEIVDSQHEPVADGKMGFLLGTSLYNYGMPFLRYVTGDVSAIRPEPCGCGRAMRLLEDVTTRSDDIVTTPDGRQVGPASLTQPFKTVDTIHLSQIVQETPDLLRVLIVPRDGYSEADSAVFLRSLRDRVGEEIRIELEFVEDIPPTATGKFRWVISKVPLAF